MADDILLSLGITDNKLLYKFLTQLIVKIKELEQRIEELEDAD